MKICVGQINPTVGAVEKNEEKIASVISRARQEGAELVVFPELVLTGAPVHDLLFHKDFVDMCEESLARIAPLTKGLDVILGSPALNNGYLYDSAVIFSNGKEYGRQFESRVCWEIQGKRVAVLVGEERLTEELGDIDLTVHLTASPWSPGQYEQRFSSLSKRAKKFSCPYLFVNLFGGNDEWIFDGSSFYISKEGNETWRAPSFEESCSLISQVKAPKLSSIEELHRALLLGIADYFNKQLVEIAHIALSGGIDSSVTAVLATQALGKDRVRGLFLPSRFTSKESSFYVEQLVKNLGIPLQTISIEPMFEASLKTVGELDGTAFENLQSRIRTTLLMALSNKANSMALGTGNKSEVALGYATLYGDLTGALLPLGDVFKTQVYELARHLKVIPETIIERVPTAELHPNQHDTDDLPEYRDLDPLLEELVLKGASAHKIVSKISKGQLYDLQRKMWTAEYKRRQSPPILRVSNRAFGSEARYPIANGLRF